MPGAASLTFRSHLGAQDQLMADFLSVVGIVAFVVGMLGLVWGLDHV